MNYVFDFENIFYSENGERTKFLSRPKGVFTYYHWCCLAQMICAFLNNEKARILKEVHDTRRTDYRFSFDNYYIYREFVNKDSKYLKIVIVRDMDLSKSLSDWLHFAVNICDILNYNQNIQEDSEKDRNKTIVDVNNCKTADGTPFKIYWVFIGQNEIHGACKDVKGNWVSMVWNLYGELKNIGNHVNNVDGSSDLRLLNIESEEKYGNNLNQVEYPRESGWYWLYDKYSMPNIVFVHRYIKDKLIVQDGNTFIDVITYTKQFKAEWFGPLEPPK
jgi:hypothetical protein